MTKTGKGIPGRATLADMAKNATITDEDRKRLTPAQLERLQRYLKELETQEYPVADLVNPEKFSPDLTDSPRKGPTGKKGGGKSSR